MRIKLRACGLMHVKNIRGASLAMLLLHGGPGGEFQIMPQIG